MNGKPYTNSKTLSFIEHYFSRYLDYCRNTPPGRRLVYSGLEEYLDPVSGPALDDIPVSGSELAHIMTYLKQQNTSPCVIGKLADFLYIPFTDEYIRMQNPRPIAFVDLLISLPIPPPPVDWREITFKTAPILWGSPSGGNIRMLTLTHLFKENESDTFSFAYDTESEQAGCPVIDLTTLFLLKLSSEHGFFDLLAIVAHNTLPQNLEKKLWNQTQRNRLMLIQKYLKKRNYD